KERPDKNHERPPCLKISDAKRMVQLARLVSSFAIFCLRAHPCPLAFSKWRTEPGSVRVRLKGHNPQDSFKHTTRRNRFAPRTSVGNILLQKMIPDAFPLLVREPNHSTFVSNRQ